MTRPPRALPLALCACCFAGCIYTFDNPVSSQLPGSISGQLVLGLSAAGQSLDGSVVALVGTPLSVTTGADGRFEFVALRSGLYTLRYTVPAIASNEQPALGQMRGVYLPPIDAQGDGDALALGKITVEAAGMVQGVVAGFAADAGLAVTAFTPDTDAGPGSYEGYSTMADNSDGFTIVLPAGAHQLWASTGAQAATALVTVSPGQSATGVTLNASTPAAGNAQVQAYLIDPTGIGDSQADAQQIFGGGAVGVFVDGSPLPGTVVSFENPVPTAGVSAASLSQPLAPGAVYDLEFEVAGSNLLPVSWPGVPLIAGHPTLLGDIYFMTQAQLNGNQPGGSDGGPDAGAGGGMDAGSDGGTDAGSSGGVDAGSGGGLDGGSDGGLDGGSGGGLDGGSDGGLDGGSGGGLDAGSAAPVWQPIGFYAGMTDCPPSSGQCGSCSCCPAGISQSPLSPAVPLPLPNGAHELVFTDILCAYAVNDSDAGSGVFTSYQLLGPVWITGVTSTLLPGASDPAGEYAAVAWIADGPVPDLAYRGPGGLWTNYTCPDCAAVSNDADITVGLAGTTPTACFIEQSGGAIQCFTPDAGGGETGTTPGISYSGVAASACDGGAACLVGLTSSQDLGIGTVDASGEISLAGDEAAPGGQEVAAVQLGDGSLGVAVGVVDDGGTAYYWGSFTFPDGGSPIGSLGAVGVSGLGPPGLFSWHGAPLLVYPDLSGNAVDALDLANGFQAVIDAGITGYPQGYTDVDGGVVIAFYAPRGIIYLYRLP